jgi:hypothetical protein
LLPRHVRLEPARRDHLSVVRQRLHVPLPPPPPVVSDVVWLSARLLVGDPGAVARLVTGHAPRPDGTCAGHTVDRRLWPCHAVQVAAVVRRMQEEDW